MSLIPGVDFCVRFVPFPPDNGTDGGMVLPNAEDDGFSIYLDEKLLWNMRKAKKTFDHERKHIEDDDFYNEKPISEIEDI